MQQAINNRYVLQRTLGAGGMGVVHLAYDRLTQQTVALKQVEVSPERLAFMSRAGDETAESLRLSLAREFQTLASLRHPHIISVLDYGFDADRQPFYTMSYLPGAQTIVEAARGLALEGKIELVQQLLQALAYLHRRQVLHRDLKPENVLVVEGVAQVLDFGLAVKREESSTGSSGGSAAYMAPELWLGQPAQEVTDLYAVGVILYELLSGRHPFAPVDASLIYRVLQEEPALDLLNVEEGLAQTVGRLLAKSPENRFKNVSGVLNALSQALGRPSPPETRAIRESYLQAAAFVGREKEMGKLTEALERAAEGQGSIWFVGGESGAGKSRLLNELRSQALVSGWQVVTGQAVMGGAPFQIWRDIIPHLVLGIELSDLEAGVLKSLAPRIERLFSRPIGNPPELPEQAAYRRLLLTITNVLRRQTEPTLLLLEDLQWSTESLEPLNYIKRIVGGSKLLVIGAYRHDERPKLREAIPEAEWLLLPRFDQAAIQALSQSILGREAGGRRELVALLEEQTEGNAFFVVEVVRALAEEAGQLAAISRRALPSTIFTGGMQQIVQRRISQVPGEYQPLLQKAAVMGRELDLAILNKLTGRDALPVWLGVCQEASVLEVQANQWRFAHDKLREGILANLEEAERPYQQELYRETAEAVEAVYPDDPTQAALLVRLWRQAGEGAKERRHAREAGEYAAKQFALEESLNFYQRALTLWAESGGEEQFAIRLAMNRNLGEIGRREEQYDNLRAMDALAERLGHTAHKMEVATRWAGYYVVTGRYPEAIEAAEKAAGLARTIPDEAAEAVAHKHWGTALLNQGKADAGREHYEKSHQLFKNVGDEEGENVILLQLAILASEQGDYGTAKKLALTYLKRAKELGLRPVSLIYNNLAINAHNEGEFEEARNYFELALNGFVETGNRMGEITVLGNLGYLALTLGQIEEGRAYFQNYRNYCHEINHPRGEGRALVSLGKTAVIRGEFAEALAYLEEAADIGREIGNLQVTALALLFMGNCYYGRGSYELAEAAYQEIFAILKEQEGSPTVMEGRAALAQVMLAKGNAAAAFSEVQVLLDYWEGNPKFGGMERPILAFLICIEGLKAVEDERAGELLTFVYNLLQEQAGRLKERATRQSFMENVVEHREIVRLYEAGEGG